MFSAKCMAIAANRSPPICLQSSLADPAHLKLELKTKHSGEAHPRQARSIPILAAWHWQAARAPSLLLPPGLSGLSRVHSLALAALKQGPCNLSDLKDGHHSGLVEVGCTLNGPCCRRLQHGCSTARST